MSDEGLLAYIVQLEKMFAKADAENARLREALQMAMDDTPGWYDVARTALAGEEEADG